MCYPFQIVNAVIITSFVFVVHKWLVIGIINKRHCDKPMNADSLPFFPFPKLNCSITVCI